MRIFEICNDVLIKHLWLMFTDSFCQLCCTNVASFFPITLTIESCFKIKLSKCFGALATTKIAVLQTNEFNHKIAKKRFVAFLNSRKEFNCLKSRIKL